MDARRMRLRKALESLPQDSAMRALADSALEKIPPLEAEAMAVDLEDALKELPAALDRLEATLRGYA